MQKPLTDAEKAVDAIIKESIKPYANRAEVLVDYAQDDGASWRIIPKNPHAALLRIYNVGNNKPQELLRVLDILEQALGRKANREMLPMQPGDVSTT